MTPHMPEPARAVMPPGCLQPLPLYLRPDFAPTLERHRPHELLTPVVNGRPTDPRSQGRLCYRYLDTGETVTVPNCWYNQTFEMRDKHWRAEARVRQERLCQLEKLLWQAENSSQSILHGQAKERYLRNLRWTIEQLREQLKCVQQAHEDLLSGRRFC